MIELFIVRFGGSWRPLREFISDLENEPWILGQMWPSKLPWPCRDHRAAHVPLCQCLWIRVRGPWWKRWRKQICWVWVQGLLAEEIQREASTLLQLLLDRKGELWAQCSGGEEPGFSEEPSSSAERAFSALGWNCGPFSNTTLGSHCPNAWVRSTWLCTVRDSNLHCWEVPGRAWLGHCRFPSAQCLIFPFRVFFQPRVFKLRVLGRIPSVSALTSVQTLTGSLRLRLGFGNFSENPKAPPFWGWSRTFSQVFWFVSQQGLVLAPSLALCSPSSPARLWGWAASHLEMHKAQGQLLALVRCPEILMYLIHSYSIVTCYWLGTTFLWTCYNPQP